MTEHTHTALRTILSYINSLHAVLVLPGDGCSRLKKNLKNHHDREIRGTAIFPVS